LPRLGVITFEEFFFQWEKGFLIRVMNHRLIVERIHQRIGERHPLKARRRQAGTHGHAIANHRFDADAIENPGGVIGAMRAHRRGFVAAEKLLRGLGDLRRMGPLPDRIRLCFEIVDGQRIVFVVGFFAGRGGTNRVSVIVDCFDRGDLLGNLRIDQSVVGRTCASAC
jgi:hypothetical protein